MTNYTKNVLPLLKKNFFSKWALTISLEKTPDKFMLVNYAESFNLIEIRATKRMHILCLAAVSGVLAILFGLCISMMGGTIMQVS